MLALCLMLSETHFTQNYEAWPLGLATGPSLYTGAHTYIAACLYQHHLQAEIQNSYRKY